MGLKDLRLELAEMEPHMLIHHLTELYKKYPDVKAYFDFFLEPDLDALLDQYKSRVIDAFHPTRGKRPKLNKARKAINEFKKLSDSPEAIAELQLFFTQTALQVVLTSRYATEAAHNRVASSLRTTLEFMAKNGLLMNFDTQVLEMVQRCENARYDLYAQMISVYRAFYD